MPSFACSLQWQRGCQAVARAPGSWVTEVPALSVARSMPRVLSLLSSVPQC